MKHCQNGMRNNYKEKGIYSIADGKRMYVLVAAGEKNTGGYNVERWTV